MSNIYVTEPPPSGKVILDTSRGEIEVELFADQCPLACKNFIALASEGYYDNIGWHRYVKEFIIQSGDPTGTGIGGESFYGREFEDEPHQRLRFNRRGLLGMANGSDRNTNGSQFFLTLGPTPELQGRHTMFGRINNSTIYNLVALADSVGEIGADDRPVYPPKLKTIRVVENPFEGQLQLRITREERLAIKKNKKEAEQRKLERAAAGESGRSRKKNTALLSFGEAEDVEEGEDDGTFKGPKSSHDLLKNDKRLRSDPATFRLAEKALGSTTQKAEGMRTEKRDTASEEDIGPSPIASLREAHTAETTDKTSTSDKIAELEASIRGLSGKAREMGSSADAKEKKAKGRGKDLLGEYRAKYMKNKQSHTTLKKDEETARLLKSFQNRIRTTANGSSSHSTQFPDSSHDHSEDKIPPEMREYGADDDDGDDDRGWREHRFDFGGKAMTDDRHDGDEYVTLDPRESSSSAAIQLGFGGMDGQARARQDLAKQGRRGRDWVDEREDRRSGKRQKQPHDRERPGDEKKHTYKHNQAGDMPLLQPRDVERW